MSNSPIEFMGDNPAQRVDPGEYSGGGGLIQPAPHEMTPSEASRAMTRAGMTNVDNGGAIIDPATGMVVPPDMIQAIE